MARVHHLRPQQQQGLGRAMALDKTRAVVKKRKPYKIVLEAVTQEKKKLHSILTYASNAPQGFGFVPAGHPEITEWCKEQCRQRNLDVHVVSAKPKNKTHADPEKLSHHVHRIGHHFPLEIIQLACSKFGYEYDEESGLRKTRVSDREAWIERQMESYTSRRALHGHPATKEGTKDYISGAVREMFPKIPEADLSSIVNHAFEEGTNRVGNAKELPLARRVQLAVVAHIRHTYTDYDRMLKTGTWMEARQKVEHVSLAKLKEWRDETGEQSNEIEDTFREVIVLDDEEEDNRTSSGENTPDEREQSMEIVSNRVYARDIQLEPHPQYSLASDHQRRQGHGRTIFVRPYPPPPTSQFHTTAARKGRPQPDPARYEPYPTHRRPTIAPTIPAQPESKRAPNYMRDSDGRLYELLPIDDASHRVEYEPPHRAVPRHVQQGSVHSSPLVDALSNRPPPPPPPPRRISEHETVLPSVEHEAADPVCHPHPVNDRLPFSDCNDMQREYNNTQSSRPPVSQPVTRRHEAPAQRREPFMYNQHARPGYDSNHTAAYSHARENTSMEMHSRHKAHTSQDIIDLTSSPRRPPHGSTGSLPAASQGYPVAGASKYVYAPEIPHRSPVGIDYHGLPDGARPSAYVSEQDLLYQRRALRAHEYIPSRR